MTKIEDKSETSRVKSFSINVSLDEKEIKISQTVQGVENNKDFTDKTSRSYKLNGAASTEPAGGQFGGTLVRYMNIFAPDKLEFNLGLKNDGSSYDMVALVAVEVWTLSGDAKILTIESKSKHGASKIIFLKE